MPQESLACEFFAPPQRQQACRCRSFCVVTAGPFSSSSEPGLCGCGPLFFYHSNCCVRSARQMCAQKQAFADWLNGDFFVFVIDFRLSGIKGEEAGGSAPVSKEYGISQPLRALCFLCSRYRLNRLFLLCSEFRFRMSLSSHDTILWRFSKYSVREQGTREQGSTFEYLPDAMFRPTPIVTTNASDLYNGWPL